MLSFNCTTKKMKHEVLTANDLEDKRVFDREIERKEIFKQIKGIRDKQRNVKDI